MAHNCNAAHTHTHTHTHTQGLQIIWRMSREAGCVCVACAGEQPGLITRHFLKAIRWLFQCVACGGPVGASRRRCTALAADTSAHPYYALGAIGAGWTGQLKVQRFLSGGIFTNKRHNTSPTILSVNMMARLFPFCFFTFSTSLHTC